MKSLNTNTNNVKWNYTRTNYIKYFPTLFNDLNHDKGEVHLSHIELFHYSQRQIIKAFEIMNKNQGCYYIIYSSFIDRANALSKKIKWSKNIALYTQIGENDLEQINELKSCKAKTKFIEIDRELILKHPEYQLTVLHMDYFPFDPLVMIA